MAKAPIMPVFTDALIGDTTHLSTEQFGAYVLILLATWRNNGRALPDDDERMAHVCRAGVKRWRSKLRPAVSEFFDISDGFWRQHRLEKEWARVEGLIAKRRASAAAGGRATAARNAATDGARKDNLEDSEELFDRPESLNAARAKEKKSSDVNPEEGRCAPLGCGETVHSERDAAITETPVEMGSAGANRGGTDDARTSLPSPVADPNRLGPGDQARTGPLAGSASSPSTRFGALRGGEPCSRTGKSPAKPAFVKYELLPLAQRRILAAARQFELVWGHQEMTELDPVTKRPLDPVKFQFAIDGTAKLIKLNRWADPAAAVLRQWKHQHGVAA
jgi:uncharacterized protein YdaU (DUF1376 family)